MTVRPQQRGGNAQPCIVSNMIEQSRAKGEWSVDSDEHVRDVSGIAYLGESAGGLMTCASLLTFRSTQAAWTRLALLVSSMP